MATSSIQRAAASGSTAVFSVPFPYLDKTHVQVRVAGVLKAQGVDYTWPTDSTIQLSAGSPTAGTIVERRRVTPVDPLTVFQPGNLDSGDLNVAELQALYVAQEASDDEQDRNAAQWATPSTTPGLPGTGGTIAKGVSGNFLAYDGGGNIIDSGNSPEDLEALENNAEASAIAAAGSAGAAASSAASALGSATSASGSATLAQKWASNPEDNPVTTGPNLYSALHWAAKAAASAIAAAASAAALALPNPGVANSFLQRNAGNTAYDAKTAEEVSEQLTFKGAYANPATRFSRDKMRDTVDLRDWAGLDLTGATDMTAIVQAAVNATAAAGQTLHIPAGIIKLNSKITVPEGANIEGPGLPADREGALSAYNAYFHLAHSDIGFHCTGIAGPSSSGGARRLAGFGTYRDHPAFGGGWTPTAASADIQITAAHDVLIEDILFYNANRAVTLNGDPATGIGSGRVTLRRLRGQPMLYGLNIQQVYDTIYIDDIHWWPFWSFDTNVLAYMKANGTACLMGRVDWPQIGRIFSWGMRDGLSIINTAVSGSLPGGTLNGAAHIDSLNVDNCERGLLIQAGADGVTLDIDQAYMTNTVYAASSMVTLAANNARLSIKSLYAANTNASAVSIAGTGNTVRIGGSRSSGIDQDATGDAEFSVGSGNKLTLATPPITSAGTVYGGSGEILPRGIVPDRQITTVQGTTNALSNSSTSAQNIFPAANDTLALLANTAYRFKARLSFNTGATSRNVSFGLGGTATFTSIGYDATVAAGPANTANSPTLRRVEVATPATMVAASTAVTTDILLEGILRTNAAGTIVPQITFSAGPTGTCETAINSFFEVEKIGADTVAAVGNWG